MVDLDLLRVDLDIGTKQKAINEIKERLGYFHDVNFLKIDKIKKIELVKKSTYGARIKLNFKLKTYNNLVMFELLFGDDWRKSANALINYHILGMKNYPNRLFTIKRYKDGSYKQAVYIDITKEVKEYVLNERRKKWNN